MSVQDTVSILVPEATLDQIVNKRLLAERMNAELRQKARTKWPAGTTLEYGYVIEYGADAQPIGIRFFAARKRA